MNALDSSAVAALENAVMGAFSDGYDARGEGNKSRQDAVNRLEYLKRVLVNVDFEQELPIELKFEIDRFCSSLKRSPYAEAGLKRNFAKRIRRFIRQEIMGLGNEKKSTNTP